ncbi:glycoside hydrolase family 16 protein [Trichocladium antarcticum]|uniref:Glycoside hydrolase family 16 protein n=1 Tax=Trichocladium antarcticum TaxID=1450529 RepID=A0AAN6ZD40_9PEZI|nr:glycoside hydrolase family 16 protein [Trichocladium antarcticum]
MLTNTLALLSLLASLASAVPAPIYPGFKLVWSDSFPGHAGQMPNSDKWKLITNLNTNNDVQNYTTAPENLQLSGGSTLQLVPHKNPATGKWTSARVETHAAFTPAPGKVTQVEAAIRSGDSAAHARQGMWPAFWMLGESVRHGTGWPMCGELDIMETVNGLPMSYGTVHCGEKGAGGPCNEPVGRGATVGLEDFGWHTWALQVDRTNTAGGWRGEVIRWLKDGKAFWELSGDAVGVEGVWGTLAHSPMFVILNVAVGGDWPGGPDRATAGSYGSMMEVEYVAVYTT